eukprot:4821750-Amphidinium_carterae.1
MSTYSVAWPADEGQLLSYIEALQKSGCGPTTLNRVRHVVAFMKMVGEVPEVQRMSKSVGLDNIMKELQLQTSKVSTKHAPPFFK